MDTFSLQELVALIEEPNRTLCLLILEENSEVLCAAPGSSHNHQAWPGGYVSHVVEVMNFAVHLYHTMNQLRPLPFSLSDALLVLFLHDIEKPWKYSGVEMPNKAARSDFRYELIGQYGIKLTDAQLNGLKYVEGEGDDYSSSGRVMNELAGFCHMCDVASARVWHDEGKDARFRKSQLSDEDRAKLESKVEQIIRAEKLRKKAKEWTESAAGKQKMEEAAEKIKRSVAEQREKRQVRPEMWTRIICPPYHH